MSSAPVDALGQPRQAFRGHQHLLVYALLLTVGALDARLVHQHALLQAVLVRQPVLATRAAVDQPCSDSQANSWRGWTCNILAAVLMLKEPSAWVSRSSARTCGSWYCTRASRISAFSP